MYERMWGNFHKIVSNGTLVGDIKEILSAVNEDLKDDKRIHSFSVNLLHEVAKCTISEEHKKNAKRAEKTVQAITVQDKAVLYYIAGNLLHCMMKRTQREELLNILRSLCSDSGNIPPEIKAWLKERDRGGLKESTFYFLQLVLSWEAILRKSIDLDCLKTTSLATDRLKEVILTDSVVQQLWHTATGSSGHQILLEALLAQFLTVRGFAVAKLVQKKTDVVLRQENTSRRKSASLRKNLKRL
ncbi:hypothetical protein BaRGS_00004132 [Batillaria attramentaria]|uniref:Uncharacterized protein n=1 Tax=Batillaria attramentaria TaxID=370345 RepID=A0ABD0LZQ0_9CAEN